MGFAGFDAETMNRLQQDATAREPMQEKGREDDHIIVEDTDDINLVDLDDNNTDKSGDNTEENGGEEQPKSTGDEPEGEENAGESEEKEDSDEEIVEGDINDDEFILSTLKKSGVDPAEAEARIIKDGGLTPEFIEELKEKVDPALVDAYSDAFDREMAAHKDAQKEAEANTTKVNEERLALNNYIFDSVGGEDKFNKMAGILKANIPADAIEVINAKLRSDNKLLIKEGLSEAVKHYKEATGRNTLPMSGDNQQSGEPAFEFMTKGDYHRIIGTEKYRTDAAYASKIDEQRLKSRDMDSKQLLPGQFRNIRGGRMYKV